MLVHVRLCSVQRILPNRKCGRKQDEAQLRDKRCIGFGSWSAVHSVAGGGKIIDCSRGTVRGKKRWYFEYGVCLGRRRSGMLGVGLEDLSGRYLLEWMPLHTMRRAANVG